ncbi:alpha/beta-hydrolase [Aspergillus sclerotioniger CBS 115572]|uniref:Alpha/beta-hydrolase n=1 Tax=Aspergillus sclerotioniger CBS 115572 TaxID=1450535 RepID=A0A317XHP8_9EURO|nr:alpha/beta-hydrolase [Aspergillus sclerotioniger CBS 115572]PWY96770.1 alpha/beta-hydrolase [Aspergillus sclerotioniger CBS 115572]
MYGFLFILLSFVGINLTSFPQTVSASTLNFVPCYQDYQCARLEVPLDWSASPIPNDANDTAILAIIKLSAQVDPTDERYGGSIIINPGGPGDSGVQDLLVRGKEVQKIIDSPNDAHQARFFDIVSFDPRGVGNTHPPLTCFPDLLSSYLWDEAVQAEGLVDSSDRAGDHLWSRMQALGTACTDSHKQGADIGPYMNTWSTAHDLRHLTQLLRPDSHRDTKLQYWGYSYGTLLSMTYASLFPDQVQRMVLDGVVDAPGWYLSDLSTSFRDADRVVDSFFHYCHQIGYPTCAFASHPAPVDETNTQATTHLKQRLTNILTDLKTTPLSTGYPSPEIITYSDVKRLLKVALYAPIDLFPILATILSDLEQGSATSMAEWKSMLRNEMQPPHCLHPECQSQPACRESCQYIFRIEVTAGIACLDLNQKLLNVAKETYWEEYLRPVVQSTHWVGDAFADFAMPCASWEGRGPGSFDDNGPIGAESMSTPILFVSNSLDPVTPLADAHAMSALFNGSVVLEQLAEGHCSFASRSICTENHIRKYFQTGTLPTPGTQCETDVHPLGVEETPIRADFSWVRGEERTEL